MKYLQFDVRLHNKIYPHIYIIMLDQFQRRLLCVKGDIKNDSECNLRPKGKGNSLNST